MPETGEDALQQFQQEQAATTAGIGALQAFGFLGALGRALSPPGQEQERVVNITFISSCLAAGTYDRETHELALVFTDGRSYAYAGVPEQVVEELVAAPSSGSFFNMNIRGVFG